MQIDRMNASVTRLRLALVVFTLSLLLVPCGPVSIVRAEEVPPPGNDIYVQTNGPLSPLTRGDWYSNNANATSPGFHYLTIDIRCDWPINTPIQIDLFSAAMNQQGLSGETDEPNEGMAVGATDTTFELYSAGTQVGPAPDQPPAAGAGSIFSKTYNPGNAATTEIWDRFFTIPAPITCGKYVLRSHTRTDDQNGWRVRVGLDDDNSALTAPPANTDNPDGVAGTNDEITVGIIQAAYQHSAVGQQRCFTLYEYVSPGQATAVFQNFDMDNNIRVTYYPPNDPTYVTDGATGGIPGTLSVDQRWNANAGSPTPVRGPGDVINNPASGWWRIVSCVNNDNQFIQEGQLGEAAYYEQPPTPLMTLTKSDGILVTTVNNVLNYTITFANTSATTPTPGAATNVVLTDTLPTNTTFQSCTINAPFTGTCTQAGGIVTARLNESVNANAPRTSGTINVVVQVNPTATVQVVNGVTIDYEDGLGHRFPPTTGTDVDTLVPPGSIGDTVYTDNDGDGIQDPGESGRGGITITLYDAAGNIIATTVTDANGNYRFSNLPPGTYRVVVTVPNGFNLTTVGSFTVNLGSGQTFDDADFGLRQQPDPEPEPTTRPPTTRPPTTRPPTTRPPTTRPPTTRPPTTTPSGPPATVSPTIVAPPTTPVPTVTPINSNVPGLPNTGRAPLTPTTDWVGLVLQLIIAGGLLAGGGRLAYHGWRRAKNGRN